MLLPKAESGPQRSRRKAGSEAQATHPWPGWGQGGSQAKRTRGDVWGVGGRKGGRWSCWTLSEKPVACSLPSFLSGPLKARLRKTCGVEDVQHPTPIPPPPPAHCGHVWNFVSCVSSVQSVSHVQLFVTPWTAAHPASVSIANSQSLLKLIFIESVMPSNHLIPCRPLLFPPSIFSSIRVFSSESVLTSDGQNIGISASTSVLPMNIQD